MDVRPGIVAAEPTSLSVTAHRTSRANGAIQPVVATANTFIVGDDRPRERTDEFERLGVERAARDVEALEVRVPILAELRVQVAATEAAVAAERMRTGARVLGRRTILRQSWRACPASTESRRSLRPRIAARSQWSRIEALRRNREFLAAYRDARASWLAGAAAQFPVGTYWLQRFAHVPLAS